MRQKAEERERYPRQMNNQKGLEKEKMHTVNGKKIENICIIGAGNIGHYLMALIGRHVGIVVNNVLELIDHASVRKEQKSVGHVELAVLVSLLAVEDIHERI